MDNGISRAEHEEFRKTIEAGMMRLDAEDKRQNSRINTLEDSVMQINALTVSVERLATSVEDMCKEIERERQHGISMDKRIKTIELRDGEMWRKLMGYVLTAVAGIIIGYIFTQIGF